MSLVQNGKDMNEVLVMLEGGMGSQMFGYAYGRALSLKYDTDLILDPTHTIVGQRIPRDYSLGVFNIAAKLIQPDMKVHNPLIISDNAWMGLDCFKDYVSIIRKDFTFTRKAKKQLYAKTGSMFVEAVKQCNSVSIGVRRGDFAYDPTSMEYHGVIPLDYYYESINYIADRVDKPVFFLFSDDIEWVKENLQPDYPHFYVSGGDLNFQEEWLINSYCKHHIISNSTFYWWSAWHRPYLETIVCASKHWHNKYKPRSDFFPKGWVLL